MRAIFQIEIFFYTSLAVGRALQVTRVIGQDRATLPKGFRGQVTNYKNVVSFRPLVIGSKSYKISIISEDRSVLLGFFQSPSNLLMSRISVGKL